MPAILLLQAERAGEAVVLVSASFEQHLDTIQDVLSLTFLVLAHSTSACGVSTRGVQGYGIGPCRGDFACHSGCSDPADWD